MKKRLFVSVLKPYFAKIVLEDGSMRTPTPWEMAKGVYIIYSQYLLDFWACVKMWWTCSIKARFRKDGSCEMPSSARDVQLLKRRESMRIMLLMQQVTLVTQAVSALLLSLSSFVLCILCVSV